MQIKKSQTRGIKVGELVYHVLYGKEWVGIILNIIDVKDSHPPGKSRCTELAVVKMQPNTKYEHFFAKSVHKKNRINDSTGMVSMNWIFKLEERRE